MLSEESCVRIVGSRGQLRVHQSVVRPSPGSGAGFGTMGYSMGQRPACWFDPTVDLLSWYNSMAKECNHIPSSGLLCVSLLAHTENKRETVDKSKHTHHFCWGKPQNFRSFSKSPKPTTEKHVKAIKCLEGPEISALEGPVEGKKDGAIFPIRFFSASQAHQYSLSLCFIFDHC